MPEKTLPIKYTMIKIHKTAYMLIAATIISLSGANAQKKMWTMDGCMEYAVSHSTAVAKKSYQLSTFNAQYNNALNNFFPKLTAEITGQYNWGRGIDPETNTYNTVTTFNNYYGVYASMYLFDGGQIINQFKNALLNKKIGISDIKQARDEKAIEIMQDFIDAAYYSGCTILAKKKLGESNELLYKTCREEELGMKSEPEVAQIKSQVAEDDYNLTHQQNLCDAAFFKLRSDMNFPVCDSLQIDTTMQAFVPVYRTENVEEIYNLAAENNPAAISSSYRVKSTKILFNIAKGKLLPTISLAGGIGTSYYKNFSSTTGYSSFRSQIDNNIGEYIGATLSVPLLGSGARYALRKARNDMNIAILDNQEAMRKLHNDIEQSVMDCNGYAKEISQMSRKVEADSLSHLMNKRKFEEGMISAMDLKTSSSTLLQSRILLLQTKMLYILKNRLVEYYKGNELVKLPTGD